MTDSIESAVEDVDGVRIHYRRIGKGPLVVLLHGWPQHSYCWRRVMPLLAHRYTVVALDQRGAGLSDRTLGGFDKRTLAKDVRGLAKRLGFDKIALIAGHDRGARIGHRFALDHPDFVERLALLDIVPTREVLRNLDPVRLWHWTFHLQNDLVQLFVPPQMEAYIRSFLRYAFNRGATEEGVPEYVKAMLRPGTLRCTHEDYRASFNEDFKLDNADFEAGRKLTTPTLLLFGEKGPNVHLPMKQIWSEYATHLRVETVPNCGYYMPEETPEVLAEHLLRFLGDGLPRTASAEEGGRRMSLVEHHKTLNELACEFIISASLRAVINAGVPDKLGDGAKTADELAKELELDGTALYRVLRLLASRGLFAEGADGAFRLTELGRPLRRDVPGTLADGVLLLTHPLCWKSADHLLDGVKSGGPVFNEIFKMPFYEYVMKNPDVTFHSGMAGLSSMEDVPVVDAYDFSKFGKIIDVGGGSGGLIAEILRRNPSVKGAVYDKPHVLAGAKLPEAAGVGAQCELIPGNFMESVPEADGYILKRIVHNWSDEQSVQILKNCAKAMKRPGRVLIIEGMIKPGNEPDFMKAFDVHMMLFFASRERTEGEFRRLFEQAGMKMTRVVHTATVVSIFEGSLS